MSASCWKTGVFRVCNKKQQNVAFFTCNDDDLRHVARADVKHHARSANRFIACSAGAQAEQIELLKKNAPCAAADSANQRVKNTPETVRQKERALATL